MKNQPSERVDILAGEEVVLKVFAIRSPAVVAVVP
jgi:hypothetical protein